MSGGSPRAKVCAACGALNGSDFDRCIRCGTALSGLAASMDGIRAHLDGRSMPATKLLVGLTALVFVGQTMAALQAGRGFGILSGDSESSLRFGALPVMAELVADEPFRLLSAAFVHFGLVHFGMNMLGMFNLARVAEPGVGSARFVLAYVGTGIASFLTTVAFTVVTGGAPSVTAGASGALFGVMGLILGVLVRRRDPRWKQFAGQAVLYSVFFGFMVNSIGTGILVNNSAHLGGLAAGFGLGFLYGRGRAPGASDAAANIAALAALGLCVACVGLSLHSYSTREALLWRLP